MLDLTLSLRTSARSTDRKRVSGHPVEVRQRGSSSVRQLPGLGVDASAEHFRVRTSCKSGRHSSTFHRRTCDKTGSAKDRGKTNSSGASRKA